jgi:hypothetical protein
MESFLVDLKKLQSKYTKNEDNNKTVNDVCKFVTSWVKPGRYQLEVLIGENC